jgi:hypothetical protein
MSIKGGKIDASGEFIKSFRIVTDIDADAGLGTPTDPLRVDPTGTTVQPVSFTTAQHVIVDSGGGGGTQYTDGTTQATPTGTVALGKDPSNVVKALPLTAAGALKVDNSAVTQPVSGTVAATQSGTWTVQPGNTANTTAWKVDGSAVTQPVSAASLPLPSGAATAANQTATQGTVAPGTAATVSDLVGGVVATSAPTGTAGQQLAAQLDTAGNLRVTPYGSTGSFTTVTASGTGSAPPTITVPAGSKYLLISITLRATVANSGSQRTYTPNVVDASGNQLGAVTPGVAAPINLLTVYTLAPGLPSTGTLSNANASAPFPQLCLGPGFKIQISAPSGAAGDALVVIANVIKLPD